MSALVMGTVYSVRELELVSMILQITTCWQRSNIPMPGHFSPKGFGGKAKATVKWMFNIRTEENGVY